MYICKKKSICTKDVNCLQGISIEDFEIAISELVTYGYVIACIYRSPNGDFRVFLKNLEFVIQKIQSNKKKKLLLCGDWNINFLIDNIRLQELKNLLESYDLINMVRCPTRITSSTESLIDVIITNRDNSELRAMVIDLGISDHLAQIIRIQCEIRNKKN